MLRALIFDVDGTLAETEEAHRRAFNETFAEAGLSWHWRTDDYRRLLKITGGKERMRAWRDGIGSGPDDAGIAELHRQKTRRYGRIVAQGGVPLRPGVAGLLSDARGAGLRLAVATTTNRPNVDVLIRAATGRAAADIFEVIAAGDDVAAKKPAPDVYLAALERLGLRAEDALAFEDSRNGVLSARAAGLEVVVTPSAYTAGEDFSGAASVLPDLQDWFGRLRLAS
ncbi:HAD-IA family hydrolase [Mangrovicoccus sp. HB161399]|uniref:HAD-IA family hydrolase n=1 Tax=Mangrovicoccus sp. HB161399 TaxID=2720392 RepID=UPI001553B8AB|nr:HAD-IA family hydrolase [Mangrovicoccus sp. HB161399]